MCVNVYLLLPVPAQKLERRLPTHTSTWVGQERRTRPRRAAAASGTWSPARRVEHPGSRGPAHPRAAAHARAGAGAGRARRGRKWPQPSREAWKEAGARESRGSGPFAGFGELPGASGRAIGVGSQSEEGSPGITMATASPLAA